MVSKMAGLSDKERIGCAKLLSLMPESDVRSLCETVTSKKIQVETTRGKITFQVALLWERTSMCTSCDKLL